MPNRDQRRADKRALRGRGKKAPFVPKYQRDFDALHSLQDKQTAEAPPSQPVRAIEAGAKPARRSLSWRTKAGIFAGGAAITGGAVYYHHRKKNVQKLYDPFTDQTVEVEKGWRGDGKTIRAGVLRGNRKREALGISARHLARQAPGLAVGGTAGHILGGKAAEYLARNSSAATKVKAKSAGQTIGRQVGFMPSGRRANRLTAAEFRARGIAKADFPDSLRGTPMIGQTRMVRALVPTGGHVSHANALGHYTPSGGYRHQPRDHSPLLRAKKGRDKAARQYVGKADKPTTERKVAASIFGPAHSAVAGRRGKKLRATGRSLAYNTVGSLPGVGATAAGLRGGHALSSAGAAYGNYRALLRNNARGYYKKEKDVTASKSMGSSELFYGGVALTPAFSHSGCYPDQAGKVGNRL